MAWLTRLSWLLGSKEIEANIVIVGLSGSGKSTVLRQLKPHEVSKKNGSRFTNKTFSSFAQNTVKNRVDQFPFLNNKRVFAGGHDSSGSNASCSISRREILLQDVHVHSVWPGGTRWIWKSLGRFLQRLSW